MQYSQPFKTLKQAQQWAYRQAFEDTMYLIDDPEFNSDKNCPCK